MEKMIIAMPDMGPEHFRIYMWNKYAAAVEKAGGKPEKIPWGVSDEDLFLMSETWDGVLLLGGPDIDPALYGREKEPACGEIRPQRDDLEPRMIKVAMMQGLPIFGICRGLQMLNVALGGTLIQDITPQQKVQHSDFLRRKKGCHTVEVKEGSLLSAALGAGPIKVNSLHHQVVDDLADGLVVTATSEDGYVEAAEKPDYPFCMAVQWHPEHMAAHDSRQQALFDLFMMACRRERGERLLKIANGDE